MDLKDVALIIVALITGVSAYASQRAASRASTLNTSTTSRVDMEREAYERARGFDTETIRRQDLEIEEIRTENHQLREENRALRLEVRGLNVRVAILELNEHNTLEGETQ